MQHITQSTPQYTSFLLFVAWLSNKMDKIEYHSEEKRQYDLEDAKKLTYPMDVVKLPKPIELWRKFPFFIPDLLYRITRFLFLSAFHFTSSQETHSNEFSSVYKIWLKCIEYCVAQRDDHERDKEKEPWLGKGKNEKTSRNKLQQGLFGIEIIKGPVEGIDPVQILIILCPIDR